LHSSTHRPTTTSRCEINYIPGFTFITENYSGGPGSSNFAIILQNAISSVHAATENISEVDVLDMKGRQEEFDC